MYIYSIQKKNILTDEGLEMFLKIRDKKDILLSQSGAVRADKLMCGTGESWDMMACIDRLVELGEIRQVCDNGAWQDKVFIKNK